VTRAPQIFNAILARLRQGTSSLRQGTSGLREITSHAPVDRWGRLVLERRTNVLVAVGVIVIMVTVTGSQGGTSFASGYTPAGFGAREAATKLMITPANGAKKTRPDRPIVVTATHGKIHSVTVSNKGRKISGKLSADGTRWQSNWSLSPSTRYQVSASARGPAGKTATASSAFTTLKPKETIDAYLMAPDSGEEVGVGMPVILGFTRPVANKDEVERALEVRMSKRVEGAWRWFGDQQVVFRTKKYWPRDTKVSVLAHMSGVRAAKGVYGTKDLKTKFTVGDSVISTVSAKKYKMTVKKNGKTIRTMPISAGNATKRAYTTTNGIHLAMSMEYHVVMDSATVGIPKGHPEYYRLDVYQAVRISNSGEYTHSAPWSVGSQGRANVSHGCINQSPKNAKWFKEMTHRGDVVIVTGTDRELEPTNGWGYWQMSWKQWKKGSALKRSVNPGATAPSPSPSSTPTPGPASPSPGATATPSSPAPAARD
jgi:lipoprotein-anchoring transpeptidase ErfK/SrfK